MKRVHVAKPCDNCPLRREGGIRLREGRIFELHAVIAPRDGGGGELPCHKTVNHDQRNRDAERGCAGALIYMFKQGASTQVSRIAERFDLIDPEFATGEHPEIFDNFDEWLATAEDKNR